MRQNDKTPASGGGRLPIVQEHSFKLRDFYHASVFHSTTKANGWQKVLARPRHIKLVAADLMRNLGEFYLDRALAVIHDDGEFKYWYWRSIRCWAIEDNLRKRYEPKR